MPIPGGVTHIILSGSLPGGETWSAGFWQGNGTGGTTAQQAADATRTLVQTAAFKTPWSAINDADTTLSLVTAYLYATGGNASDIGQAAVTGVTGSSNTHHPNQIAMVMTMRSATLTRRGRNRCYLPATGVIMEAGTGLADATAVQNMVNGFATVAGIGIPRVVSVASNTSFPMVSIDADRVMDQQTSRRDSLPRTRYRKVL